MQTYGQTPTKCRNYNHQPSCSTISQWLTHTDHQVGAKTHVLNANLQKQLLSEFDQKSKIKSQEFSKFVANKKALYIWAIWQSVLSCSQKNYPVNPQAGRLIEFLNQLHTFFWSDNSSLSFGPYKQVIVVKLMNNYSNNKPDDPYGFKEEVKIKHDVVKAVASRFLNGTAAMMKLLSGEAPPIDWDDYCQLTLSNKSYGKREATT